MRKVFLGSLCAWLGLVAVCPGGLVARAQSQGARQERVVGGLVEDRQSEAARPRPVRNDVAQPGQEIVTLRYFKIKAGTYDQFFAASRDGVWPYFEKIGARVIGQWKVIHPNEAGDGEGEGDGFEEIYMLTRYASYEHWRATREMATLGGNGPDWEKCREAIAYRRTLTVDTWVKFLQGHVAPGGPYFLPGLGESYDPAEGKP